MEPLKITQTRKAKYMKYLAWLMIMVGVIMVALYIKETLKAGEWDEWFLLIEGIIFSVWGYMGATGRLYGPVLSLIIDKEGINQEKARGGSQTVRWNEIKSISLDRHHIRFTYSGADKREQIKLPPCSYKQRQKMKSRLGEAAETHNLEYEIA